MKLFALADRYCQTFSLGKFALLKTCCLAFGAMLGMAVPKKREKLLFSACAVVFTLTYLTLMLGFFHSAKTEDQEMYL